VSGPEGPRHGQELRSAGASTGPVRFFPLCCME